MTALVLQAVRGNEEATAVCRGQRLLTVAASWPPGGLWAQIGEDRLSPQPHRSPQGHEPWSEQVWLKHLSPHLAKHPFVYLEPIYYTPTVYQAR